MGVNVLVSLALTLDQRERNEILQLFQAGQLKESVHFTDGETKVPKGEVICLRSHKIFKGISNAKVSTEVWKQIVCVCVCVCVYACVCVYTCVFVCIRVCVCVCG